MTHCDRCNKPIDEDKIIVGIQKMLFNRERKPYKRTRKFYCLKCNFHHQEFDMKGKTSREKIEKIRDKILSSQEKAEKYDLITDESLIINPDLSEENKRLKADIENRKKVANLLQHDNSQLRKKLSDVEIALLKHQVSLGCYKTQFEKVNNQYSTLKEKLESLKRSYELHLGCYEDE